MPNIVRQSPGISRQWPAATGSFPAGLMFAEIPAPRWPPGTRGSFLRCRAAEVAGTSLSTPLRSAAEPRRAHHHRTGRDLATNQGETGATARPLS
jgi:hypothetical protein